uniref:Pantothenate kinase 4 (Trinotate prediction) n=1 Tax=Myxobolus squamalis TaxID=59785 RepID=A0A6B2G7F2_MYXSQ
MTSKTSYESIRYPINMYGDVKHTTLIGLDIGGSLAKLVYLVEDNHEKNDESKNIKYHMRFVKFETKYIESCLDFIQKHYLNSDNSLISNTVYATGGGSIKFKDLIINKLGLQ